MITVPFADPLNDVLEGICERLQLTEIQQKLAEQRYNAVGEWLAAEDSLLASGDPHIYPQGSLRTGTTVKPIWEQEYDLDLVCELNLEWEKYDPVFILDTIEKRLRENGKYAPIIKRKNRCIRLDYANEFHLDVLPACPDCVKNHGCVKVPDRKLQEWKDSNPRGYAEWFENQSARLRIMAKAAIDPLPDPEPAGSKSPLKRAVQLLKRHRDIAFLEKPDLAPISIVLTTLAGSCYNGNKTVAEALSTILEGILKRLPPEPQRLVVLNPTNPFEDFSEKWDENPLLYESFKKWVRQFSAVWREVRAQRGIHNFSYILQRMFGEELTKLVMKEQAEIMEKGRKEGFLKAQANTGTLLAGVLPGAISVKRNTFFGE